MNVAHRVFLYGNSVILGTLGISLRRHPQFEVTELTPPLPGPRELAALKPDVIIFDLKAAHNEVVFSMLQSCHRLVLIGISPDTNLVKVWSGRQLQELSTQDLLDVINGKLRNSSECLDKEVKIQQ